VIFGTKDTGAFPGHAYIQDVDSYNPVPDVWSSLTDAPGPARQQPGTFVLDHRVYACGGVTRNTAGTNYWAIPDTDCYANETWTSVADMPPPAHELYERAGFLSA